MTMQQKKSLAGVSVAIVLGLSLLIVTGVAARSATQTVRIEIVLDQMAFLGAEAGNPSTMVENPTLRLRSGQLVEIVLRSQDRGMKHDLVIVELDKRTEPVGFGESATVRFTAPAPGTYTYYCSIHPKIMRGQLIVTD